MKNLERFIVVWSWGPGGVTNILRFLCCRLRSQLMAVIGRRLLLSLCGLTALVVMLDHIVNMSIVETSKLLTSHREWRDYGDGSRYSVQLSAVTTSSSSAKPSTTIPTAVTQKPVKKTSYPLTLTSPYLINNPSMCKSESKLNFVFIVHTSTDHFNSRNAIRQTWGNIRALRNLSFRVVFFLGLTENKKIQTMLENESTVYGDIIQGQFMDSYHNLTHKGVLTYRWISEFCSNTELVVKVDDDMFVNIFNLVDHYLPIYRNASRKIMCHLRPQGTSPIMREKSKWQVHVDHFKNMTHYPVPYCNGYFVLISSDIIRQLYRASYLTPFFWVDDVYLYGLLPQKIGNVTFTSITVNLTLHQETGMKCYTGNTTCKYLASYAEKQGYMESMWFAALRMFKNIAEKIVVKELL